MVENASIRSKPEAGIGRRHPVAKGHLKLPSCTETVGMQLVLFSLHNRMFGPYLAAMRGSLLQRCGQVDAWHLGPVAPSELITETSRIHSVPY
jgi:hypothetical protein